jgi:hypothetical protein
MAQQEQIATTTTPATSGVAAPRGLKLIIGAMVFAAIITVVYWVIWYGIDRTILASSQAPGYFAFENAFPVADGWLALTLVLGAIGLARRRPWGLLATLLAGGAGIYLGCMDVLFDLENGIYLVPRGSDPSPVIIEIIINVLTFLLGGVIITYVWRQRRWFLGE